MLDTGSTVTLISEKFLNKHKIQIPVCKTSREVTMADGSKCVMREWKEAILNLNPYLKLECDILISPSMSYDMLFGLNACEAIGANIYPDCIRYNVEVEGKERFGKIPISSIEPRNFIPK